MIQYNQSSMCNAKLEKHTRKRGLTNFVIIVIKKMAGKRYRYLPEGKNTIYFIKNILFDDYEIIGNSNISVHHRS